MVTRADITRTIYLFGSLHLGPYRLMTFAEDGRITSGQHPAEETYELQDDGLAFLSGTRVTSRLTYDDTTKAFLPADEIGHYLLPKIALAASVAPAQSRDEKVFVNTLPKAGTYLLYEALKRAGFHPVDLHVMDRHLHDNRGVAAEDIHFDPASREVAVGAVPVASIMADGEFAVGHLTKLEVMRQVSDRARLINVVREPRSMLLSMYEFTRRKVKPKVGDRLWHSMAGVDGFKAFLLTQPIDRYRAQITTMCENFDVLRFEDLLASDLARDAVGESLHRRLSGALAEALGQKTSTYLAGTRDRGHAYFSDPEVGAFLEDTGIMEVSRAYWPDLN